MQLKSLEHLIATVLLQHEITSGVKLERPADTAMGDFATTIALQTFKNLSPDDKTRYHNPKGWAEKLAEEIKKAVIASELKADIQSVEVAGPGFINFRLSDSDLFKTIKDFFIESQDEFFDGKKISVEFTDPNPFKEFHIGHLYSNTVGESLSRLFEAQGGVVKRFCYQGDVGLHVAKSVWGMRKKLLEEATTVTDGLHLLEQKNLKEKIKFLGQAYAFGATAYEENAEAAQEIKEINLLTFLSGQETLEEKENWIPQVDYRSLLTSTTFDYEEIKLLFSKGRTWSLEYFEEIYTRLGMKFDDFYFESIVGEYGVKIVREFLDKGVFEKSNGAIIFPGSKHGLHDRVFINSLGLPTYEAKELGLAPEKYRRFPYDLSFIITGNEINDYFKVLLKAMSFTYPELSKKTTHLSHGMVRLPEGKMSSRTGKILTGEWLLDEAKQRIQAYFAENGREFTEKEVEDISELVGQGAIKYALLRNNLGKDISFSFEESLSFQGNSGPYLQYTAVRAKSILAKAGAETFSLPENVVFNAEEKAIVQLLSQFNETIQKAAREYAPHHVCTYLYALAQAFNTFYNKHSVLGEEVQPEERAVRLALTQQVAQVVEKGLSLLGISIPEKM